MLRHEYKGEVCGRKAAQDQQAAASQQQTGATHASHGSRGAASRQGAFTERFHPVVCGKGFVARSGMPARPDTLLPPRYGDARPLARIPIGGRVSERRVDRRRAEDDVDAQVLSVGAD